MKNLLHIWSALLLFRQHNRFVQQADLNDWRLQFGRFAVHLHRDCFRRHDACGLALCNARAMAASLQQWQLVRRQTDHLDQPIVGGRRLELAARTVPRMCAAAVALDVEENDRVHAMLLQFRRHVLAVALERHQLGQALPFATQQVLAAGRAVEHFVAQPRVELFRVRFACLVEFERNVRVHAEREIVVDHVQRQRVLAAIIAVGRIRIRCDAQVPAIQQNRIGGGNVGEYLADWLVGVAAAPAKRPRQIVAGAQRQHTDRRRRTDSDFVQHRQHPANGAVAAAGQQTQLRRFAEQFQAASDASHGRGIFDS